MALINFPVPPHDDGEDFAGDIAFEAANCLELRVSGCCDASGDVVLRACVQSKPPDGDDVDGTVRRAIPTPVQSVPNRFPGRNRDGADAAQCREARLGSHPVGVVARREQQLRCTVHADRV